MDNFRDPCGTGGAPEHPTSIARVVHAAGTQIGAALVANAVILLLSELVAPVPLVTAMLATLAFASVWLGLSDHFSTGTCQVLRNRPNKPPNGPLCALAHGRLLKRAG